VVTDEQLQQLATAEVVPPVHSPLHHKVRARQANIQAVTQA
jgi:hypothetical protein